MSDFYHALVFVIRLRCLLRDDLAGSGVDHLVELVVGPYFAVNLEGQGLTIFTLIGISHVAAVLHHAHLIDFALNDASGVAND